MDPWTTLPFAAAAAAAAKGYDDDDERRRCYGSGQFSLLESTATTGTSTRRRRNGALWRASRPLISAPDNDFKASSGRRRCGHVVTRCRSAAAAAAAARNFTTSTDAEWRESPCPPGRGR